MEFTNYLSPLSWRYGSDEMRQIWSERNKRLLYRKLWGALAKVQSSFGLVTQEQVEDLSSQIDRVNVERSLEIEAEIHHDLMAEIKAYAEQCPLGGGIIHMGATSADIEDNTDVLRIRQSLDLVIKNLTDLLKTIANQIEGYADLPIMGQTHLQPAEPTTLGYRLAQYAQDLFMDWEEITKIRENLRGKGFRGAVGTSASFGDLIGEENLDKFNAMIGEELDLTFFPVTTQTYPRKQDYQIISGLASLGSSLYKFAFDLRILQSPTWGELSEPFSKKQVGSSTMPFKRNPVKAEKIDSLGRYLAQFPRLAWDNASHSLLERTLDDSANRRMMLPEAFLITDELLNVSLEIMKNFQVNETAINKNFEVYGPFAATERVLMALNKKGANRQDMHERIREHSNNAWKEIQSNRLNPLTQLIITDEVFLTFLSKKELEKKMDASNYLGDAPRRALNLAKIIIKAIHKRKID